jgi:GR25 family glycosyltransferase involved in LPS biosynthesis
MRFQGLYLNMERAQQRRAHMEAMLKGAGVADRYRRVEAIDGTTLDPSWEKTKAGAKGCYLSHVTVLKQAAAFDGITHIVEDDVLLTSAVVQFLESAFAAESLVQFDIVFLSLWVDYPNLPGLVSQRRAIPAGIFRAFDIRLARISSTDSYIVNRQSAGKLVRLLEIVGPTKPVDNMLQYMAQLGEVKAGFVLPFVTAIEPNVGVDSAIVQIPFDRYRLLTLGRRLVSVDSADVVLPSPDQVTDDQKPSLEFLRSLVQASSAVPQRSALNPFSIGYT